MIALPAPVAGVHSVIEVDQRLIEWDRRVVKIRGWMNVCGAGRGTGPFVTQRSLCGARSDLPISIPRTVFAALKSKPVVLRVRGDATCRRYECTDRYSLLKFEGVEAVFRASPKRSN